MSKYTTGEIAKLCGVTVRTVQYYDTRGVLVPSELTEGGRRLYSEEDLQKMKIICFLRGLDFSIDNIAVLFKEENPDKVIALLIEQQEQTLRREIDERQKKLATLSEVSDYLKGINNFSVESIGDIARVMENKKKLRKVRIIMLSIGIPLEIAEVGTFIIGISQGFWIPFIIAMVLLIIFAVILSKYYYDNIAYICPECHKVFRSSFRKIFFANHTPNTRKLACPHCNKKSFCVETYNEGVEVSA
ncbi:MAG: MerR family transcriptional regulator [Ruminiclostridium sp.]|nr:MerR family transcriptional regulator [Ruminiclostridium sp.]